MDNTIKLRIASYDDVQATEYDFTKSKLYFDESLNKDEALQIVKAILARAAENNSIVIDRLDIVDGKAFDLKTDSTQFLEAINRHADADTPKGNLTYMFSVADSDTESRDITDIYNEILSWGRDHRTQSTDHFLETYDPVEK